MTLSDQEFREPGAGRDMTESVEDEIDLYPGRPLELAVAVNAESGTNEDVDLTVGGPLARWATIKPDRLTVAPGEEHWATVRFDVPLNAGLPAGPTAFSVDVIQHRNGNHVPWDRPLTWSAEGLAFVMPVESHRLTLVPARGKVRVDVTNDGNISIVLELSVRTVIGNPRAALEETSLAVAPGATNSTWLRIGGNGSYEVISRSHDGTTAEAVGSHDLSSMAKPAKAPKPERDSFREAFSRESAPRREPISPEPPVKSRRKAPKALVAAIAALLIGGVAGAVTVEDSEPGDATTLVTGPGGAPGSEASADPAAAAGAPVDPALTTTAVTAPPATRVSIVDDRGEALPPPNPLVGEAPDVALAPLHRLFSAANSDYLYASKPADIATAKKAGFTDQGVLGYIATKGVAKTAPLRQMLSKDGRHLFLADDQRHEDALAQGYKDVKTIGFVYKEPVGTGLPLMRASIGPLLSLTTIPVEQQRKLAAGWLDGGIVGFLLA